MRKADELHHSCHNIPLFTAGVCPPSQKMTESHVIARLATLILSFQFCMHKYVIKRTLSKSFIRMDFVHPFWWLLVSPWTVRFGRLRQPCCQFIYLSLTGTLTLTAVFLGVIPSHACLQQPQLNSDCSEMPPAVWFHVVPNPQQEVTADPDPRLDRSTSISDTSRVWCEVETHLCR